MTAMSLQYYFDIEKKARPLIPPILMPAQAIKIGNLGLHSASSALMWIYVIQSVSTFPYEQPGTIKRVIELDPKFSYPYAFAALTLSPLGFSDDAVEIARKGMEVADPDWRIPYYLATTYHIFFQDRKNAAIYFDIAANTPGAPEKIKSISARYGIDTNILEKTKQIWMSIYDTSNDETVMITASKHITHIEMLQLLEKAISVFRQRYRTYPDNLEDLVTKKILKEIPVSPLGINFGIKPDGRITVQ